MSQYPDDALRKGPLRGTRAIVLTQAWAGSFCSELLGLLGAEVIQVESRQRPDVWRGGYTGQIPAPLRARPQASFAYNTSPSYNSVNLNKYCITLNLSDPRGIDIFRKLVPFADVVAENFTPRVMGNFGLAYEDLKCINPAVILVSLSAYGATGPYANVPGIGGTIEPMAGLSALLGYEDGPPVNSGAMYPDPVAGYHGAAAALIALRHRRRTGEGQHVDLSMQETSMTFIADALIEFSLNRRVRPRIGNHDPVVAPHNIYPTRDGRWIALAARTEEEWARLCTVAGRGDWLSDSRFAGPAARKDNEAALDRELGGWTSGQDSEALEARLIEAGLAAAVVRAGSGVRNNPHLRARGFIATVEHPEAGVHEYAGVPLRLSRTPGEVTMHAPQHGEHSWQVLSQLLGISREYYDELVAADVTGSGPPSAMASGDE